MSVIEFRDVSFEIDGRRILSGVNFRVESGETLVLLGRSGSGKSTALKLTNGMLFPTRGEVLVEGRNTCAWDPIRLKRSIGYVIQETGLFPHFTVAEKSILFVISGHDRRGLADLVHLFNDGGEHGKRPIGLDRGKPRNYF